MCLTLLTVESFVLPDLGFAPGPLHSIVRDREDNLYYSDEINHSLVSLDADGDLRWHLSTKGRGSGEFWYPMGLDVGKVRFGEGDEGCIAVCDAWNGRVQFLRLDGTFLGQWLQAGESALKDPVDVRFMNGERGTNEVGSYWLVLDRSNHRLCGLDLSGRLLFQIGRQASAILESRWAESLVDSCAESPAGPFFRERPVFDPLFMPQRIFGTSPQALFLSEPAARRLKQVCIGNLIPLWVKGPKDADWIAADEEGLVAYGAASGLISSYDGYDPTWHSAPIEGRPLPGSRSSREIWIQHEDRISRIGLRLAPGSLGDSNTSPARQPARRLLGEIDTKFGSWFSIEGISELQMSIERYREIGETILEMYRSNPADSELFSQLLEDLEALSRQYSSALKLSGDSFHTLIMALFKSLHLCSSDPAALRDKNFVMALATVLAAVRPVSELFERFLRVNDDFALTRFAEMAVCPRRQRLAEGPGDLSARFVTEGFKAIGSLANRAWFVSAFESLSQSAQTYFDTKAAGNNFGLPWLWLQRPHSFGHDPGHFREIERIYVGGTGIKTPAGPAAIARTPEDHLLVTLQKANRVIRLDPQGKMLGPLEKTGGEHLEFHQPHGVAVDVDGNFWISETARHCLKVLKAAAGRLEALDVADPAGKPLFYPEGLLRVREDIILVADGGNHRLLMASAPGTPPVVYEADETEWARFRQPFSFCAGEASGAVWVVERRNHRLQLIDLDGGSLRQIGRPGLGAGCLILPEHAAVLEEGTIAVSQSACVRAIKVFASNGQECGCLALDYYPKGMLFHHGLLLVCEHSGDHIRVYERR